MNEESRVSIHKKMALVIATDSREIALKKITTNGVPISSKHQTLLSVPNGLFFIDFDIPESAVNGILKDTFQTKSDAIASLHPW
jgi:hypothetical protein